MPGLVDVQQIADMLGVSRQRADVLTRSKGFPEPTWSRGRQRIWDEKDIRKWAVANGREISEP